MSPLVLLCLKEKIDGTQSAEQKYIVYMDDKYKRADDTASSAGREAKTW